MENPNKNVVSEKKHTRNACRKVVIERKNIEDETKKKIRGLTLIQEDLYVKRVILKTWMNIEYIILAIDVSKVG